MLEIGLTIVAWLRGWKARSLLPLGIGICIAFLSGLVMGALGASIESIMAFCTILEVACIGTLIYMIARPPKKSQQAAVSNLGSPVTGEPLSRPVKAEPATVVASVARAKLILPDNSEISVTEAIRPIGRDDFDKTVSAEALKYISRQHLLIRSENGKCFVEDLNSVNGTKTNGIDIRGRGRQELRDGDRIEVADVAALTFKTCELS